MTHYIQFKDKDLKGNVVDAIGTDGVFILDGRNGLNTMFQDGMKRMLQLRRVHKYVGFVVMKGSRFDNSKEIMRSY